MTFAYPGPMRGRSVGYTSELYQVSWTHAIVEHLACSRILIAVSCIGRRTVSFFG